MPFDVDLLIWVGLLWYPVNRSWLLHTWTSATLFTSHKAKCDLFVAKIFGYHASHVKDPLAGVKSGEFLLQRYFFDSLGLIWCSKYFGSCAESSKCFKKQISIKWLVIPFLMRSRLIQVSLGACKLSGFVEPDKERKMIGWEGYFLALELFFRITWNLTGQKIVFSRLVVPFFYSDLIINIIPAYLSPMFVRKAACKIMLAPLVVNSESSMVGLQTLLNVFW